MTNEINNRKRWYVIQAATGYELRVQKSLTEAIKSKNLDSFFGEILVPAESIVELKDGKKCKSKKKFFPGYILAHMIMNEDSWYAVKSTPHVLGFLGGTFLKPVPISDQEADNVLSRLKETEKAPRHRFSFEPGEEVRVLEGPFADFLGTVDRVDYTKNRLFVLVSILGRATPIEVKFQQVTRD